MNLKTHRGETSHSRDSRHEDLCLSKLDVLLRHSVDKATDRGRRSNPLTPCLSSSLTGFQRVDLSPSPPKCGSVASGPLDESPWCQRWTVEPSYDIEPGPLWAGDHPEAFIAHLLRATLGCSGTKSTGRREGCLPVLGPESGQEGRKGRGGWSDGDRLPPS